jgi:hypothetical protein
VNSIEFELQDADGTRTKVAVPYETHERVRDLIARLEGADEVDRSLALDAAIAAAMVPEDNRLVGEIAWPAQPIHLQRVCVELHFEGEAKQAQFPAQARWARVHRWGCRVFTIATDACAHLELREDTPTGPALNERQAIGPHSGCKPVWLVKPGPEPNG